MAEVCCESGANEVQLMAQDPDYTEQTKEILEKNGFTIVGQFGAGGFAEIDEESVVFSAFVEAPLKQIIADIARPTVIIGTTFGAFNDNE
ncbi:Uu.00g024470.m01.CDS01 [Anthostomella pinea]|uniref:Uu.00g024470.m01.CDS01 n=1 Tax=Anthostomella pinea TaxID=933095 RepID=A0AAI8YR30_9PEZI|nr:Uu.00g024470.m01.CDS01 [Anthostomella pinea]